MSKIFDGSYFVNEGFDEDEEYSFSQPFEYGEEEEEEEYAPSFDYEEDEEEEEEEEDYGYGFRENYDYEDDDELVYSGGEIFEAKVRLNAKEKRMRDSMSQLMNSLNREPEYVAAKDKFVKIYKKLAKQKISELGLKVKLAQIDKITVRDLD